jgi:hypothetical protein
MCKGRYKHCSASYRNIGGKFFKCVDIFGSEYSEQTIKDAKESKLAYRIINGNIYIEQK